MLDIGSQPVGRVREGFGGQRLQVLPTPVVQRWLASAPLVRAVPSDAGYFKKAFNHGVDRPRGASGWVLIYCVSGAGWVFLHDRWRPVRAGGLAVLPPEVAHTYGAADGEPWTIHWAHVASNESVQELNGLVQTWGPVVSIGFRPDVVGAFEQIEVSLEKGYRPQDLRSASAALAELLNAVWVAAQEVSSGGSSVRQRIELVLEYMQRNLSRTVRVEELAAKAHLSRPHFGAVFKRLTGYSVLDYFLRLKMKRACELLDHTDRPVGLIAAELGYDDPLYFSRMFKRFYDCSPSGYRKNGKG